MRVFSICVCACISACVCACIFVCVYASVSSICVFTVNKCIYIYECVNLYTSTFFPILLVFFFNFLRFYFYFFFLILSALTSTISLTRRRNLFCRARFSIRQTIPSLDIGGNSNINSTAAAAAAAAVTTSSIQQHQQ